jgi:hypothetical protein
VIGAAAALIPLSVLAGCAGEWERSHDRWNAYRDPPGPYSRWALCIQDRSRYYLDPEAPPPEAAQATSSRLFTHVLADCREHMSGSAWESLDDREVRRLISDAWQEFNAVGNEMRASYDSGIT